MGTDKKVAVRGGVILVTLGLYVGGRTFMSLTDAGLIADFLAVVLVGWPFLHRANRIIEAGEKIQITTKYLQNSGRTHRRCSSACQLQA